MKCKVINKQKDEVCPTAITDDYSFFSIGKDGKQEFISFTSCMNNQLILILSNENILIDGKSYSNLVIVPMRDASDLSISFFSKTYIIAYNFKDNNDILLGIHRFISPYNYVVEELISDIHPLDEIVVMALKHLALLSLTYKKSVSDFNKIQQFIFGNISNTELSLDLLSEKLFMSRRKIQYILSRNETSYGHLVDNIRFDILKNSDNSDLSIQQILSKAGLKNITTANRIFMKKLGITMREYFVNGKR